MRVSLNAIQIIPIETKPTAKRVRTTRQANSNAHKPSRDSSCESLTIRFLSCRTLPNSLSRHFSSTLPLSQCRSLPLPLSDLRRPLRRRRGGPFGLQAQRLPS